jgi:hypothetical protein
VDWSKLWSVLSFIIFWITKYQTTPWNVPISIFQDYFKINLLVEIYQGQCQHHLFVVIPFGFKYPLILEPAITILEILVLASFLRVIPIRVPSSTRWPTSPRHKITFPTPLASVLKILWYLACVLDLNVPKTIKTQTRYTWGFTLSYFRSLFYGLYTAQYLYQFHFLLLNG